jgi:hypothetical protein
LFKACQVIRTNIIVLVWNSYPYIRHVISEKQICKHWICDFNINSETESTLSCFTECNISELYSNRIIKTWCSVIRFIK